MVHLQWKTNEKHFQKKEKRAKDVDVKWSVLEPQQKNFWVDNCKSHSNNQHYGIPNAT